MEFYRITNEYVNFLRTIDKDIMNNEYESRRRPYVGVVLTFGIHQYFAPLSSYKPKYDRISNHTIHKVVDNGEKLSVVKLNCMFPIIQSEIELMDFEQEEQKYKDLLEKEYRIVKTEQEQIKNKAKKLYDDVKKGKTFFKNISCDFEKLEEEYVKFVRKTT